MEKNETQSLRERMIVAMTSNVMPLLAEKTHSNTWIAEQIARYVDTFISQHEPNALIPVHVPHPLNEGILKKITHNNGTLVRTVPVNPDDFFPYDDEGREECINEMLIKEGHGHFSLESWRMVGYKDNKEEHLIYLEVTGVYTPSEDCVPRGRTSKKEAQNVDHTV